MLRGFGVVDRGVRAGVVLVMLLAAGPAAGLQDGDVPGYWLVEPGEVVEWKGYWDYFDFYEFGRLEGAPLYGQLSLSLPWNLKVGGLAGRFWVEFKKNYGYIRGKRYGRRYGYGLGGSRSKPKARGMPARLVRVETMRVLLDGEPYLTIRGPTTDSLRLDFPYPVRELELRVELSEGSALGVRVRLPERHRELARGVDFRKGRYLEGPRWPHEGPFFVAPLREGDGWVRPGKWGCLTRPELGRVRLARIRVERHPRLGEGEEAEMEIRVHQPVFELLVWDDPFPIYVTVEEDPRFRVRIVCETDRGRRLEEVYEGELIQHGRKPLYGPLRGVPPSGEGQGEAKKRPQSQ